MPNDYIDQVKLTDNTVVDIKDTVSGYITSSDVPITIIEGAINLSDNSITLTNTTYSDIHNLLSSGKTVIVRVPIMSQGFMYLLVIGENYNGLSYSVAASLAFANDSATNTLRITSLQGTSASASDTVVLDASSVSVQEKLTFDGTYNSSTNKAATVSTVTNAINALDGGTIGTGGTTKTITSLSQSNGNVSATFSNIAFPVTSVNSQTGAVSLSIPSTASDVGAIASPSSASSGQFLKYNGTNWVADNVPGGASPSDTTPSESTETGSAGTSSAYSRGDHSHPKEVLYIEYGGSATLTEIKDWWDAGKAVFVNCNFTSTVGDISLPCVNCTSSLAKFSTSWNGVEYWAEFDDVEWDGGEIELLADTKTSFYGTSSTGATTQAKTTTSITGYALRTGNIVAIKFSNANTYTSNKITLNVSSTGAKDVWYQGAVTSSTNTLTWNAGQTLTFVYTGSVYICISKDDIVPEVTFVKYGTATFSEVEAAQGNGKLVIAYNQNEVQRFAPYMYYDTGGAKHKFYYIDEDGEILIWTLDSNNTWSSASSNWYVPRTRTINSKALSSDITLTASDISGTVEVANGGTGKTSFTANQAIISGSTTTGAFTSRAITNNTAATTSISGSTNLITLNTLRYALNRTTGPGTADTNYSTSMMRAISAGTSDLTAGTSTLTSGAIYLVYEA